MSIRPNFAIHAAKGKAVEVANLIGNENRDDIVITNVEPKLDAVLIHVGDETYPERLMAKHPDKITEVERFTGAGQFKPAARKPGV